MWRSSSSNREEDKKRKSEDKISHISKYSYKSTENGQKNRDYMVNYPRNDNRNSNSRQKSYSSHHSRDNRYSEKRYNDLDSKDEGPSQKYQKRSQNYGDYDHRRERNYEDEKYNSRKRNDKYKSQSHSQKNDYRTSKRSNRSPRSPYERRSPYKSSEKSRSNKGYEKSKYSSPSPRTPTSDRISPQNPKFSPPQIPPFEPPVTTKVVGESVNKNKQQKNERIDQVSFSHFYETKRHEGKYKENGPDPRLSDNMYGNRVTTKFDLVRFPKNPSFDTTLDSPEFTLEVKYDSIYNFNTLFQTPLERINHYLFSPRPKLEEEWWLKGTLSLLLLGIPRNWGANEVLNHLVGSHNNIVCSRETLPDEWKSDSESEDITVINPRKTLKKDCKKLGIVKFILLFGDQGVSINEIPNNYPGNPEKEELEEETEQMKKRFISNDQPEGMGLLVFESEEKALSFWSIMGSNLIQAYPYTMRVCPDPSGWRIYSEALSLSFQNELLTAPSQPHKIQNNDTIDLLSVLTTPNSMYSQNNNSSMPGRGPNRTADSPGSRLDPKNIKGTMMMFVCSYISNQDEANQVARSMNKFGVKCMYHKNSKIMSIQFPDEKTFHSTSFGHKVFTTHTGSRAQCCFIRCEGKAIPIIKRSNMEHISNFYDKNKNQLSKPVKFKPPMLGIVNVEDLNE